MVKPDFRHALRPFIAVSAVLLIAAGVRCWLQPATFGEFGPFRGAAVATAREPAPKHLGEAGCVQCHAKQVALHDKDAHTRVPCESCHGAGQQHVAYHRSRAAPASAAPGKATAGAVPQAARLRRPKGKEPCLQCHERLAARPGSFPQVAWREHYAFVGVKTDTTPCVTCHDPHEPLYMDRDLRQARLHPVVHRCRDCHAGAARDESMPRPAGHPAIFECGYCHKQIVADFEQKKHKHIRCSTCHLFFAESQFAGRIIRDADPRFCLLCHRGGDFRSPSGPPSIEWPAHRDDMSQGPADANKRCIDCHQQDHIHRVGDIARGGAADNAASPTAPAASTPSSRPADGK